MTFLWRTTDLTICFDGQAPGLRHSFTALLVAPAFCVHTMGIWHAEDLVLDHRKSLSNQTFAEEISTSPNEHTPGTRFPMSGKKRISGTCHTPGNRLYKLSEIQICDSPIAGFQTGCLSDDSTRLGYVIRVGSLLGAAESAPESFESNMILII